MGDNRGKDLTEDSKRFAEWQIDNIFTETIMVEKQMGDSKKKRRNYGWLAKETTEDWKEVVKLELEAKERQ